jgi:hypothetical protein
MSKLSRAAGALKALGEELVDWAYGLSFLSTAAYSGAIVILVMVAVAVSYNFVEVPEFHPK